MKVITEGIKKIFLYLWAGFFFAMSFVANFYLVKLQHFTDQAQQFLHGQLGFTSYPNFYDFAPYHGQWFWPLGPMPSVLLMPGVYIFNFFHATFDQSYLGYACLIGIFFLCFGLARKFSFSHIHSIILACAFCFASVFLLPALIPSSWSLSHIICVFLVFLGLWEFFHQRRYWLIGVLFGMIFATRFTAGFSLFFFIYFIYRNREYTSVQRWQYLAQLVIPVAVSGVLLLWFNYARFDNAFDNGYMRAIVAEMSQADGQAFLVRGLFGFENIPKNFYFYFIKPPELIWEKAMRAGNPGMSIFVVAPFFLYIFETWRNWRKSLIIQAAWVTLGGVLLFLLSYYHSGWVQLGPRYTLDFLPFVYLLILYAFPERRLPLGASLIIFASSIWDLYFLYTLFPYLFS